MALTLSVDRPSRCVAVVRPSGKIDADSAADFDTVMTPLFDDPGVTTLVVDMSGVAQIFSAGQFVLLTAIKAMRMRDATLALAAVRNEARSNLKASGIMTLVRVCETVEECLQPEIISE